MSMTPFVPSKSRVLLLSLVFLIGVMSAEALGTTTVKSPDFTFPVRALGTSPLGSPITRTVVGHFNDDADLDFVMLRDGKPEMVPNAMIMSAALSYPSGAASPDIARLPQLSGVDELLTIESGGLRAWKKTSTGFSSRTVGSSAWSGTEIIRTGAFSGAGRTDIVGYRDSDEHLVLLIDPDTGSAAESSFEIARPALDIVPFVRKSNGTVQFAIRTSLGVLIYALDGTYIQAFTGPADGALAAIDVAGADYQNLGWIHSDGSDQVLEIIVNNGTTLTRPTTPITVDCGTVAAMISANMDGTGNGDLVVSHRDNFDLIVLTGTYGAVASYVIRAGGTEDDASSNSCWPAIADFDNDGDSDVIFSNDETSLHYVYRNDTEDHTDDLPIITEVRYAYHLNATWPAMLQIDLDDVDPRPADANYIEIVIWTRDSPEDDTDLIGERYLIELESEEDEYLDNWVWLEKADTQGHLDEMYFYIVRYVEVNDQVAGDPVIQTFATAIHGFTTATIIDTENYDYLLALPGTSASQELDAFEYSTTDFNDPASYTFLPKEVTNTDTDTEPIPETEDEGDPGGSGGLGG